MSNTLLQHDLKEKNLKCEKLEEIGRINSEIGALTDKLKMDMKRKDENILNGT